MGLFNRRKVEGGQDQELARLRERVHAIESSLRQLELEQTTVHDQVRKWMRRAVAAERNAERAELAVRGVPAPQAARRLNMWGARARIAARRAAAAAIAVDAVETGPPEPEPEGETNGVHS